MRIISGLMLLVCVIFNLRLANIVIANLLDQHQSNIEKEEALLTGVQNGEETHSVFSEKLEISTKIFKENEKEELLLPSKSAIADSSFLDTIEVSSKLSATAETVIFSSTETVAKLKSKVKPQFQSVKNNASFQLHSSFENENEKKEYVVHAEPKIQVEIAPEKIVKNEVNESKSESKSSQEELKKTAPQHAATEDIPSFREWTQKQLAEAEAEAEKKKSDENETSDRFPKTRGKYRNKNYASPDCGAKIVAANPESLSSSSVLSSLKDEYMLNYCTSRIWFVVELCESIQAKQLDLANFELFSSSPKHFSVFVSHRFPTREWSNVGKFTAQDSRDVQTFILRPHLFGKFVKVELHSHYGREQFCPISWVGVYGTSEYEVLAKEDERHSLPEDDDGDSYDEEIFEGHRRDSPKNLFSSATDAVLSIVKKATAPFMKADSNASESENTGKLTDEELPRCISPRFITVCNNCTQTFYDEVFTILSCCQTSLTRLIFNSFVKRILIGTESCTEFGLDFGSLRTGAPFPRSNRIKNPGREANYLTVMLKNSFVAALCNALAVFENKVVVNATGGTDQALKNVTEKNEDCEEGANVSKPRSLSIGTPSAAATCEKDRRQASGPPLRHTKSSKFTEIFKPSERFSEKIEPTKTLTEDEAKRLPPSEINIYSESTLRIEKEKSTEVPEDRRVKSTSTPFPAATLGSTKTEEESFLAKNPALDFKAEEPHRHEKENKTQNSTNQYSTLESIIGDIDAMEKDERFASAANAPSATNVPTESIFLRLANRIKTLEINMSLSSTYLEELSKRYRTQLELLSKTLNLTIQQMEDRLRSDQEKEQTREKEILALRSQLANLTRDVTILVREKNSWRPRASSVGQHAFFVSLEIVLVWAVFNYRNRSAENKNIPDKNESLRKSGKKFRRRNSLEGVRGHETPKKKTRRPSDEALEIALSRNHSEDSFRPDKKRKRKKKESKSSMSAIQTKRKKSEVVPAGGRTEKFREPAEAKPGPAAPLGSAPLAEIPRGFPLASNPQAASAASVAEAAAAAVAPPPPSPSFPQDSANPVAKAFKGFSSSPIFMKTALAARNSRFKPAAAATSDKESSQQVTTIREGSFTKKDPPSEGKSSNGLKKYMKKLF